MTRKELREKAERLVADVQGWKEEDYKRPRHEVIKMHGGATFVSLVEAIESFGLEIARAVAEDCAKVVETEFAPAYVEQIFPEVSREYIKEHSSVITGASGRMGRHLCEAIPRKIREYAKRLEGEK